MKEGGGGDHVSVGIRLPRTGRVKPISKKDLYRRRPGRKSIVAIVFVVVSFQLIDYPGQVTQVTV